MDNHIENNFQGAIHGPFTCFIERMGNIDELGALIKWTIIEKTTLFFFHLFYVNKILISYLMKIEYANWPLLCNKVGGTQASKKGICKLP